MGQGGGMKKIMLTLGLATACLANLFAGETLQLKLVSDREAVLKGSPQEVVVKIGLSAIAGKKKSRRTPLNLAVVLDKSGSMNGAKLEKTKQAAMQLVDRLAPNDIFSLVVFSDEARVLVSAQKVEDIVLDVMLPGASGYEICKQLRARKISTPILMLTAKGQEIDKVVGLDLGADDYVTKPFGVRELLARVQALLRRTVTVTDKPESDAVFQIGSATIDPKTFQVKRGKTVAELTAKELKLLQVFHAHTGEVLSRDKLLNEVWGYNYYGTTRTLDQVIVQLRKKLGDHGGEPRHLLTIHGVGYKLAS
jgi:DNA-binding response OmpR family regulator